MHRSDRRYRARQKIKQRKRIIDSFGLQGGLVYERHRRKITQSLGYMRKGNVSHYAAVRPPRKTRSRNRYGHVVTHSRHDRVSIDRMDDQLNLIRWNPEKYHEEKS